MTPHEKAKRELERLAPVAGNGLLHRRAFLRGGATLVGAMSAYRLVPSASAQKLAHDEECPPLSEQIEGPRHRAELSVALHAPDDNPNSPVPQYGFRTGGIVEADVACPSADHSRAATEPPQEETS